MLSWVSDHDYGFDKLCIATANSLQIRAYDRNCGARSKLEDAVRMAAKTLSL
jgi:hypothetical protein